MKKHLFRLTCLLALIACNNQKASNEQTPAIAKTDIVTPHIFHGWTLGVSKAELNKDGSIIKWSELEPDTTKYALYLDNALITIYDNSTRFHYIEEYLGKYEESGAIWYNIATIEADTLFGYIRLDTKKIVFRSYT